MCGGVHKKYPLAAANFGSEIKLNERIFSMGIYANELLAAHDIASNKGAIRQSADVLLSAIERDEPETVLISADWLIEIATRIKLTTRIKSRTKIIEKYASGTGA